MIYLDNSATTPLSPSTKQFIINTLDIFGNPSSLHQEGVQANKLISNARESVAKLINANTEDKKSKKKPRQHHVYAERRL